MNAKDALRKVIVECANLKGLYKNDPRFLITDKHLDDIIEICQDGL